MPESAEPIAESVLLTNSTAGWIQLDPVGGLWLVVSLIVIAIGIRPHLRKTSASQMTSLPFMAGLLILAGVTGLISLVTSPILLLTLWQVHAILCWSLLLPSGEEGLRSYFGRQLIIGWIIDAVWITAAVQVVTGTGWTSSFPGTDTQSLNGTLAWGMVFSAMGRLGLLPTGANRDLQDTHSPVVLRAYFVLIVPVVGMVLLRAGQLLESAPESRMPLAEMMAFGCLSAVFASMAPNPEPVRKMWRQATIAGGLGVIALTMPAVLSVGLLSAAVLALAARFLLPQSQPNYKLEPAITGQDWLARLTALAADNWRIPRLWKVAVELPIKGSAQVLRFADGLIFEQLPLRFFKRLDENTADLRRALPEKVVSHGLPLIVMSLFLVLVVQALR